jgi:hypothetical protein
MPAGLVEDQYFAFGWANCQTPIITITIKDIKFTKRQSKPNLFKIFINDFPDYIRNCPDPIQLNDKPIHCLMYADDIILLSSTAEGLQAKLDILDSYCNDWCLTVNPTKKSTNHDTEN